MGKRIDVSEEGEPPIFLDDVQYFDYWPDRPDKLLVVYCVNKNHEKTQPEFKNKHAEMVLKRLQEEKVDGEMHK